VEESGSLHQLAKNVIACGGNQNLFKIDSLAHRYLNQDKE
jgi:hypothetical protein